MFFRTHPTASSAPVSLKPSEVTDPGPSLAYRYGVFLALAVGGCLLDLLTKQWIFAWRGMPHEHPVWWLWQGYVGVETSLNPGALFGMGKGLGSWFALLSVVAAVGILLWLFRFGAARQWVLTIALGCVLAGIGGNLYDRLGLWHVPGAPDVHCTFVRDWILFSYAGHNWPNFNLADSFLVCGACLLMWHSFTQDGPQSRTADAESAGQ